MFIDTGAGSLTVEGVDGLDSIEVTATIGVDGISNEEKARELVEKKLKLSLTERGDRIVLDSGWDSGMWGPGREAWVKLEVRMPSGLALEIDDGSGSIVVDNVRAAVRIDDGSGSIRVENLDGLLNIDDGSGSIKITDINNDVTIDDGSGSLSIDGVTGNLRIDDGSGSVDMKNIGGTVEIEDGSGSINAKVIGGDFILDDGSGDVVIKELNGEFELIDDGSGSIRVNGNKVNKR